MQTAVRSTVLAAALVAASPAAYGQTSGSPVPREEALALVGLVDRVRAGEPGGGDAWLKWNGHFLRAADGRVYVPFSLTFDDVTAPFAPVAIYVRVAPRGSARTQSAVKVTAAEVGTAVSVPESNFSHGNPTAGEASARMGLLANELSGGRLPFEGLYVAGALTGARPEIRRSLVVPPGDYDLYVAVRERPTPGGPSHLKSAVMQGPLTVPALAGESPTMSSLILADRITPLGKRLSLAQQVERPYAINAVELSPRPRAAFEPGDTLSVVFFAYNLAVDEKKLPDVTVRYRFRQTNSAEVFGEMAPQRFSRDHTPPQFDLRAGRQLAVTQALPLAAFPAGAYELEVLVTDHLAQRSVTQLARFSVGSLRQ